MLLSSAAIARFDYNPEKMYLRIFFGDNRVYVYAGVPKPVYEQFVLAPSKGRYYNRYIKGRYRCIRIPNP